ncbi:MAG: septum site-determining protein MinC, partial [Syntrophomonadaceae bacterium]|nr:septum site-determining protein MinC [Syntrophomonadaceae bacterium]
GCYGDRDSIIFALSLNPGQIRIADKISRSPEDAVKSSYPEIAYLEDDSIIIKEYKTNSKLRD